MRIVAAALGLVALLPNPDPQAGKPPRAAIARVWHGRVPASKADAYAKYLGDAIPKFRAIPGNRGYQMMRENAGAETHFMVISFWESRDAIHAYAGADISKVRSLPRDAEFLLDPEQGVRNYDLVVDDGPAK